MKTKIRKDQLTKEEMEEFKNKNCKLLSSKQLAELLQVTEGAIRKQRSKDRSLFPYAKLDAKSGEVIYGCTHWERYWYQLLTTNFTI